MNRRCLAALISVMAVVLLVPVGVAGQTRTAVAGNWSPSRTPWGDPDLQGTWTNTTTTPLERPDDLGGRELLTDEERSSRDEAGLRAREQRGDTPRTGETGSYNNFWVERGIRLARTSLIVDPADGRLPSITPSAQQRADNLAALRDSPSYPTMWDEPSVFERCITRGMPATMMPGFYNHNYQILQTPGYIVILVEMIHDTRIIPLDDRPHLPTHLRQWLGDSRGRWEGETLVVETTNFTDKVYERRSSGSVYGASEAMRVEERFTRVDADTIDYQFTVTDPTTFEIPWTASIPMTSTDSPLFEYACHEGNYAMPNMLRGAREREMVTATGSH